MMPRTQSREALLSTVVYSLLRLSSTPDNLEFVATKEDGQDYLVCFTERAAAEQARAMLDLVEVTSIEQSEVRDFTSMFFWLDGRFIVIGGARP